MANNISILREYQFGDVVKTSMLPKLCLVIRAYSLGKGEQKRDYVYLLHGGDWHPEDLEYVGNIFDDLELRKLWRK